MTSVDLQAFNQAVQFAQTGQKNQAYQQLKSLQAAYQNDPGLILWLIFTSPHLAESQALLNRLATLDPNNPSLPSARAWLAQEQAKVQPAQYSAPQMPQPYQQMQPVYAIQSQPAYNQIAQTAQMQPLYPSISQPVPQPVIKERQTGKTLNRVILAASSSSLVVGLGAVVYGILRLAA